MTKFLTKPALAATLATGLIAAPALAANSDAFRDYLIEKIPELLDVAEHDGDDLLLERGRERALEMIETLNALLPARFRRVLADDEPPFTVDKSPEEIWRTMAEQDAASLRRKAEGAKTQARPRRRKPKVIKLE